MPAKRACLCNICNCGRHKCPHNPRGVVRQGEPCVYSEYKSEYKPHERYAKEKDFKPNHQPVRGDGPMDDMTTHRADYIEHPMGQHYVHKHEDYKQPDGEFDHRTNYSQHYTRKNVDPVKPIRHEERKRVEAKFEGDPTYKSDYRRWDIQPRTKYGPNYGYQPSDVPFDGTTNYHTDFIQHSGAKRTESLRPHQAVLKSEQPFEDGTDYKSSYIRHDLPPRHIRDRESWEPNPARMDEMTNYKTDYVPRELSKTASCKPDSKPFQSDSKLSDLTTHRDDYRVLPLEKRYVKERETYKPPEGGMDSLTTHREAYTQKSVTRPAAIRPAEAKRTAAAFDGTTQYSSDYRPHGTGERASIIKREHYSPNEAKFEGEPTYKTDYVPYMGFAPTRSLKPSDPGVSSNAPLDDGTEYKESYTHKFLPPCPSDALLAGRSDSGYVFKEQDELGHRWYEIATRA